MNEGVIYESWSHRAFVCGWIFLLGLCVYLFKGDSGKFLVWVAIFLVALSLIFLIQKRKKILVYSDDILNFYTIRSQNTPLGQLSRKEVESAKITKAMVGSGDGVGFIDVLEIKVRGEIGVRYREYKRKFCSRTGFECDETVIVIQLYGLSNKDKNLLLRILNE